jgi:hypothetical protein
LLLGIMRWPLVEFFLERIAKFKVPLVHGQDPVLP